MKVIMTAEEAKQALKEGKKVAYNQWKRCEYIKQAMRLVIVDEEGNIVTDNIFNTQKDHEWEIVE
jgi:hypothetical protein